jgi:hypothetical protein
MCAEIAVLAPVAAESTIDTRQAQLVGAAVVKLELGADKYLPCLLGPQL